MSDQKVLYRQTALRLRDMASKFLGSVAGFDDPKLRRKLTRWAFELVQEAVALEPIEDQAEPGSLSPSGAAAHVTVPVPRRRSSRPMATRASTSAQLVRPIVPDAAPVLQASRGSPSPEVFGRRLP